MTLPRARTFGIVGIIAACAGCGGETVLAPVERLDEAWCDIRARPCLSDALVAGTSSGPCRAIGARPVPASPPGGERICFDGASITAGEACAELCTAGQPAYLDSSLYGADRGCSASVNTAAFHRGLDAQGRRPRACRGQNNGGHALLSTAGTNAVSLSGTGIASYAGAEQSLVVTAGRFSFSAPDTSCSASPATCSAQVNILELEFEDFSMAGLAVDGLTVTLAGGFETAPGQWVASVPGSHFVFSIPQQLNFDAVAAIHVNGKDATGLALFSTEEVFCSLDMSTGAVALEFSLAGTLDEQRLQLAGTVTTDTVIDQPPKLTAPAAVGADADAECSTDVTLTTAVSSPVGLAVSLDYLVDGALAGSGDSITALLPAGIHQVTTVATDALGATSRSTEALTVTSTGVGCP